MDDHPPILGLILAGGRGRRIGGDKPFQELGGTTLLERSIARMRGQVDRLVINGHEPLARFEALGLPVIADTLPDQPGPLAGILAGLEWAAACAPEAAWMASVPVDAPFIPLDLVRRLHMAAAGHHRLVLASSAGRLHPVVGLWPVTLRHELRSALARQLQKVSAFTDRQHPLTVDWPVLDHDPFFNINTLKDLSDADSLRPA